MTRLTLKEKSLTIATIMLIVLIILIGLSSCGPAHYLKKAERAIEKAKELGADVKKDTIIFHFKSPEIKFETTIRPEWINGSPISLSKDTLIAMDKKTGATIKAKIQQSHNCPDSCNTIQTVYLSADVPPQDQRAEVPCDQFSTGYTKWDLIILALAMIPGGWLLMTFVIVPLVRRVK